MTVGATGERDDGHAADAGRATIPEAFTATLVVALSWFTFQMSTTWGLRAIVVGLGAVAIAGVARGRHWRRRVAGIGALLVGAVFVGRAAGCGLRTDMFEAGGGAHHRSRTVAARLVDEEDGVQLALGVLGERMATAREMDGFAIALDGHYSRLREQDRMPPTPLTSTVLGIQSAAGFDRLSVPAGDEPRGSLVFFHGAAGNWALLCTLVADAAAQEGFETVCPSTDFTGRWDSLMSRAVARGAIRSAREANPGGPVVLAGLSNGAATAHAWLDEGLRSGPVSGVLLLYGVDGRLPAGTPVSVVYGARDERFRAATVRDILTRWEREGRDITSAELDADHFGLVKAYGATHEAIRGAIRRFVEGR